MSIDKLKILDSTASSLLFVKNNICWIQTVSGFTEKLRVELLDWKHEFRLKTEHPNKQQILSNRVAMQIRLKDNLIILFKWDDLNKGGHALSSIEKLKFRNGQEYSIFWKIKIFGWKMKFWKSEPNEKPSTDYQTFVTKAHQKGSNLV